MQNEPTTTAAAPLEKQHLPQQQQQQQLIGQRHLQTSISQRGGALYPSEDVYQQFKPAETTTTNNSRGGLQMPQQQLQQPHLMNQQGVAHEELPCLSGGVLHPTPPKPAQPVAPAVTTTTASSPHPSDLTKTQREVEMEEPLSFQQKMMNLPTTAKMPAVALSTWRPVKDIGPLVENALRAGYRHFDCAWIYGNQVQVGDSLQKWINSPASSSIDNRNVGQTSMHNRRDELFISSKVWNIFHTDVRAHCLDTLHQLSLKRLDLLLLQWPTAFLPSRSVNDLNVYPTSPNGLALGDNSAWLLDTWRQMEDLVREGLVSAIGVCNFNVRQIERIVESCSIPPSVIQVELHPLLPQFAIRELCARYGICLVACPPLGASSDPSSSSSSSVSKATPTLEQDPKIVSMAREENIEPEELIYRYALEIGCGVVQKASQRLETMRKKIMVASISPSVSGGGIDERREEPFRHDASRASHSHDSQRGEKRRLLSPRTIRRLEQMGDESPHRFIWFAGARNLREYPF